MIDFLAVLFILFVTCYIGYRVGISVQDEIRPGKHYIVFMQDTLLLCMTALYFSSAGWGTMTVIVILLLICARMLVSFKTAYAPVSGALVAASYFGPKDIFLTIVILGLVLSYLSGAVMKKPSRAWMAQPIAGLIAYVLITTLPQMLGASL